MNKHQKNIRTADKLMLAQRFPHWQNYAKLFLMAGSVLVLDQLAKNWVRANLALGEVWMPWSWLAPYARIVNWHNDGAVFGLFQGKGDIFMVLAVVVVALIIYYFPRISEDEWPLRLAMGLQLGGALGNLVDRIQFGYVTDFLSVGKFWVFNIADASVTLGAGVLLLMLVFEQRKENEEQLTPSE